jgi:hypothetical protein
MDRELYISPRLLTCVVASVLLFGNTIVVQASTDCVVLTGCDSKICEKENELEKANEYGDITKILALKNSLVYIKNSCAQNPDISLDKYEGKLSELKEEYKEDLDDAFDEYEDDLAEAKSEGKPEKIQRAKEKYEQKVKKVTGEYENKLNLLQGDE